MRLLRLVAVMVVSGTAGCFALFSLDAYGPPASTSSIADALPPDATEGTGGDGNDGASTISRETQALQNAFTVKASDERVALINVTIERLKTVGVWDKIGLLYVLAAHDEQAARVNWKSPGLIGTLRPAGGASEPFPPFTADVGYKGNGAAALTTEIPVNEITGYSQNNAHAGVWLLDDVALSEGDDLGGSTAGLAETRIQSRSRANQLITRLNDATSASVDGITTSVGHVVISRSSAASYARYKDGVSLGDATVASTTTASSNARILAHANGRSTRTVVISHWGAALTAAEIADASAIFASYLTAVGAR